MVGDPGKGSNSGAQYYAINSDDKRSRVIIDDSFIQKTNN
ncbi:type III effector, partial [Salmonella enterica]|nr:type III effector [Salmonella enterica]